MRVRVVTVLVACFGLTQPARAEPAPRLYVLAIGNNALPITGADADPRLQPLRYADDDAAAFAQFARDAGAAHAIVLSNFDADTTRRVPRQALQARPPLLAELRRAVRELNERFARDRAAGVESDVLLSYSGHGVVKDGGPAALTLADGELTHEGLYREVLAALEARFVHVVVDACHAAAIVRPRDAQAEIVALAADEVRANVSRVTLRGLPNVGALIATSASAQAQEWDGWQQGVFSHQVLSGLRGGADVNGDLRIEYSEMAAFLSAANREVGDPQVRVRPVVKAPEAAPRAALVNLSNGHSQAAFLVGHAESLGRIWVESEDGERIADVRSDFEHYLRLLVPAGQRLFVGSARGESEVRLKVGQRASFEALSVRANAPRARGSAEQALRRGLFATAFGPAYYRGFVDSSNDWVAVPMRSVAGRPGISAGSPRVDTGETPAAWVALGVSGALLLAAGGFGVAALDAKSDFDRANGLERASTDASQRFETYRGLSLAAAIGSAIAGGLSYVLFVQD
jgi:hypothetical protein